MKRSFAGNRCLDPLNPQYFYPGGAENINVINDPYGEVTCSMSKANFASAKTLGVKGLKEQVQVSAGAASSKAASSIKSDIAASENARKSNRPQTAMPVPGSQAASSRKSIIQEAVAKRSTIEASRSGAISA